MEIGFLIAVVTFDWFWICLMPFSNTLVYFQLRLQAPTPTPTPILLTSLRKIPTVHFYIDLVSIHLV